MADVKTNPRRKMEEDLYLINKVKDDNDTDSINELIERHSGIYIDMVNKYIPDAMEGLHKEDIMQDRSFCIYDAALNFDQKKNTKFSTYIGNLARWKCLNIYNKNIKFPQSCISDVFDERISCSSEINNIEKRENIENIFKALNKIPDKRARKIFKMRYKDSEKLTPWRKIAKKLDLSIQGCINIHNKNLTEIKKYV